MESFLNRYRNITVLLLVIFAQLVLLAVQVKNSQDVHLIRVWSVTAVSPAARILEAVRGGGIGFIRNYITLRGTHAENQRLSAEVDRLKMENVFLKNELNSADRAKELQMFQAHTPSRMLAATVIMSGAGSNSRVVFVDRGSSAGVMKGMAVVTPDGIVGKIIAAYPTASEVLLITDSDFAAGVVGQKSGARGTIKGQATPMCKVDYVPQEVKVEPGEWFYTSGDDRVFPRGLVVGQAKAVRPGQPYKEILVEPTGIQRGLEDVLIVIGGVHQDIPDTPPVTQPVYIGPAPPVADVPADKQTGIAPASAGTEADKLRTQYKTVGDGQNHKFGEGEPHGRPPDFSKIGAAQGPEQQGSGVGGRGAGTPVVPPAAGAANGQPAVTPRPGPVVAPPGNSGTPPASSAPPKASPPAPLPDTPKAPPKKAEEAPKKQPVAPGTQGDGRGAAR